MEGEEAAEGGDEAGEDGEEVDSGTGEPELKEQKKRYCDYWCQVGKSWNTMVNGIY